MSELTKNLAKTLYNAAREDLEAAKEEQKMTRRIGMVLQAMKSAVQRAHVYTWNGVPHVFTGKIYEPCEIGEFRGVIFDVLDRKYANMPPEDMTRIEQIQRMCLQVVQSKILNVRKDIIVFENCVLCLGDLRKNIDVRSILEEGAEDESRARQRKEWRKGETSEDRIVQLEMKPHDPELAQTTMCHFSYDPKAECPMWERFLGTVIPNHNMQMVLQEFLGCIFIDRAQAKTEAMCILVGNGANGKSVVADTVRGIVGNDSMTVYGLDSMLCGGESLHNIAKMNGKRLNYCTEIQAINAGRYSDKLKTLISGEPFECRQLYGDPFTARDIPLLMANCNNLPQLEDTSYGMQRRFIIIRFDVTIEKDKQDKQLTAKLATEYAGIFNWIMFGRQRYIDQGFHFSRSKIIDKAVENYVNAPNTVREWINLRGYSPTPTDVIQQKAFVTPVKSMYDDYRRWCIGCEATPLTKIAFSKEFVKLGFMRERNRFGNCYQLYGETAFAQLTRNKAEAVAKGLKDGGKMVDGQEIRNGILLDIDTEVMAKNAHISKHRLDSILKSGWLEGCYTWETRVPKGKRTPKRMRIFDHNRVLRRLEAAGIYDQEGVMLSPRRQDAIMRAEAFNNEMRRIGEPWRKLDGNRNGKHNSFLGCVVVDPDWEYSPDAAIALRDSVVSMKMRETSDTDIVVGEDGKALGRRNKKRIMLSEAIEKELTSTDPVEIMQNSGELVDAATGEIIMVPDAEIDMEDESLLIE